MSTPWLQNALAQLAKNPVQGYNATTSAAAEPTALAALALLVHRQPRQALPALQWLASKQLPSGAVPVLEEQDEPCWTTSLALMAWQYYHAEYRDRNDSPKPLPSFERQTELAVRWSLAMRGEIIDSDDVGHNTRLTGWPWVAGTHSWLEPTALHVIALKAAGHGEHPRVREAIQLLADRLLPNGGCNYGNVVVLGQVLKPHPQPSGVVLLALANEDRLAPNITTKLEKTRQYLVETLPIIRSADSLAWILLGLAAHNEDAPGTDQQIAAVASAEVRRGGPLYRLALLALASRRAAGPLHGRFA
ncbi:MAG: hypothetical protein KDA62_01445 [Planctomycetales bacterium]|nr:hypothetical protein [Planctomycetales bacterium]